MLSDNISVALCFSYVDSETLTRTATDRVNLIRSDTSEQMIRNSDIHMSY